jgi:hypothetical protein
MNTLNKVLSTAALATVCFTLSINSASAVTLWNEDINGDLSDNGLAPTNVGTLQVGTNSLKATFNAGTTNPSPDYFTFKIPKGLALKDIILNSWSPLDEDIAFFAVQQGSIFDFVVPPNRDNAVGLLGWTHLRIAQVGTNILPEMAASNLPPSESGFNLPAPWVPGATGFSLPLKSGEYSFWLRQGGDVNITVEMDFNTVPVPETGLAPVVALGLGLGGFLMKKRRKCNFTL